MQFEWNSKFDLSCPIRFPAALYGRASQQGLAANGLERPIRAPWRSRAVSASSGCVEGPCSSEPGSRSYLRGHSGTERLMRAPQWFPARSSRQFERPGEPKVGSSGQFERPSKAQTRWSAPLERPSEAETVSRSQVEAPK